MVGKANIMVCVNKSLNVCLLVLMDGPIEPEKGHADFFFKSACPLAKRKEGELTEWREGREKTGEWEEGVPYRHLFFPTSSAIPWPDLAGGRPAGTQIRPTSGVMSLGGKLQTCKSCVFDTDVF